ncbi:MAG: S8 family serine peptidase [Candidatus Neomarinimicrobiota bacterium]
MKLISSCWWQRSAVNNMLRTLLIGAIFCTLLPGATGLNRELLTTPRQADGTVKAWIYFADKGPEDRARSVEGSGLTQRALARRSKVMNARLITEQDVPVRSDYIATLKNSSAKIRTVSKWLNACSVEADLEQLERLAALPFVADIRPLRSARRRPQQEYQPVTVPSPTARRTTLDYGYAQGQIEQINAHTAHENGYFGAGVLILILDTGYSLEHPVFDSLDIVAQYDFVQKDSNTANETGDVPSQEIHGTQVFSVLGGYAPGSLIGPAFESSYLLAKTEDDGSETPVEEDYFVAGLEWGENLGADVMSTALGYLDWYEYSDMDGQTAVTTVAVNIATSYGMLCVTSAGNEAAAAWHYITAPADAPGILSVGAVDAAGQIASFSSRGPTYDGRIKPEVCARGFATAGFTPAKTPFYTTTLTGTSYASPLVSGAAAIILSAHPDWTPRMVREALMKTADSAATPDTIYGYGVIDVWAAINFTDFTDTIDPVPLSQNFRLLPAWPNPFNAVTNISLVMLEGGQVELEVFNLLGQRVAVLHSGYLISDIHTFTWRVGERHASGIYWVRARQGDRQASQKLLLLK